MMHPNVEGKVTPELVSGFLNQIEKDNSNTKVEHAHSCYSIEYFDEKLTRLISLYGIYAPDFASDEHAMKAFNKFRLKTS